MSFAPAAEFPVHLLVDGRIRTLPEVAWTGRRGDVVHVPAGTISDGATVPWFVRSIVATWGRVCRAALVHDVLCELLNRHRRAVELHRHRMRLLPGSQWGPPPPRPPFTAVDTDHVFRLILAELGTPTVLRWIYWTGVRYGALANPARRDRWWSTAPLVAAWTLPTLLVLAPAAAGALASRLLLAAAEAIAWPVTRRAPRPPIARRAPVEIGVR